jgi:U4/U6.U5 tri-snRNP-associated protein 3
MAEPPTKRARRTDSSAMWDTNDKRSRLSHTPETEADQARPSRYGSSRPENSRTSTKDDRRYRSRSRDRYARKRDRSWSRDSYERTRERDRDRDRDGGKRDSYKDGGGVRDRDRSTSRDRYNSRRGMYHANQQSALHS